MTAYLRNTPPSLTAESTHRPPILTFVDQEPWMNDALCAQTDPDSFFPEKGHSDDARAAIRVCGNCQVRQECLAYALETEQRFGVWGGLNEHQRRKLRKRAGQDGGADQ